VYETVAVVPVSLWEKVDVGVGLGVAVKVCVRLLVWLASVLVNVPVGRPVMLWDPVRLKVCVGRPVREKERVKLAVWVRLGRDPVTDSVMARVVLPDGVATWL